VSLIFIFHPLVATPTIGNVLLESPILLTGTPQSLNTKVNSTPISTEYPPLSFKGDVRY
jgi:hypothetical protein